MNFWICLPWGWPTLVHLNTQEDDIAIYFSSVIPSSPSSTPSTPANGVASSTKVPGTRLQQTAAQEPVGGPQSLFSFKSVVDAPKDSQCVKIIKG